MKMYKVIVSYKKEQEDLSVDNVKSAFLCEAASFGDAEICGLEYAKVSTPESLHHTIEVEKVEKFKCEDIILNESLSKEEDKINMLNSFFLNENYSIFAIAMEILEVRENGKEGKTSYTYLLGARNAGNAYDLMSERFKDCTFNWRISNIKKTNLEAVLWTDLTSDSKESNA